MADGASGSFSAERGLVLRRVWGRYGGLFGVLESSDYLRLATVERPWAGNAPYVSCVPAGKYDLEPHDGKYSDTWALVGGTVTHYREADSIRSCCVFHVGNYPSDVQGCIAVGRGTQWGHPMVFDSEIAMMELRKWMRDREYTVTLEIRDEYGDML